MGLLKKGKPMSWFEASPYVNYVREHGIKQFLIIYNKVKNRKDDVLKWGDEIEYLLLKKDSKEKKMFLSLRAKEILDTLIAEEEAYHANPNTTAPLASWKPEYGRFMLEGTPFFPYEGSIKAMLQVEENMKKRRQIAKSMLNDDEFIVTMTMFPSIGASRDFTRPPFEPNGPIAQSLYLPDEIINEHPRFGTLTKNIRLRRNGKVCILVPLFMDEKTDPDIGHRVPWDDTPPTIDFMMSQSSPTQYFLPGSLSPRQKQSVPHKICGCEEVEVPSIYMDAMGFGMGCCCMQCTFQARDINEARFLYDHLAVLCPIFLALTAATPIVRGLLADTDVRWNIVSASVDDRTTEEKKRIAKSRYDSVSLYIHDNDEARKFSDLNVEYDESVYNNLKENGIDHMLAKHVAHLFIRDPLVIFTDCMEVDDNNESDHFENIQSTNWQTVRFKPPPPNSSIGWRVEFRVMEVQLSDFENAAFSVFIVLLTRVMLSYNLNFYMPLSKVDNNMAKAHKRGAVTSEKFYFRTNIDSDGDDTVELLTINEIMNGGEKFVGLIPLMRKFLDEMKVDMDDRLKIEKYMELVSKRASGELMTAATYIRSKVTQHPAYSKDSIVDDEIAYSLLKTAEKIAQGNYSEYPELFGDLFSQ